MFNDRYCNPISACTPDTAQAIDDFIHGFLSYQTKAANILAAADAAQDHCLANAYAGMIWMFLEAPNAAQEAQSYIDKALATANTATPREASCASIVAAWAAGDIPQTMTLCETHAKEHPRDLAIIKLAQYHHFNVGDAPAMLRLGLSALPDCENEAYVHGMIAFGYEQCHLLDQAEASARRALEIEASDPWAHHAIAHVMLTQGRTQDGVDFMESVAPMWRDLNSFMRSHNWWHLALFYLSQGRHDDVRRTYDTHVWGLEKSYSQDQVGAVSLLARMEFAGVDVEDRWTDVANHIASRGADTTQPFLTMQYLYALGRTNRTEAQVLMAAVTEKAQTHAFDQALWQHVALPACRGILAYTQGDFETCLQDLGLALPRMAETGGSHAQRDLFEQIHLDALMKTNRLAQAQQALEMRRTYDPDGVPLNLMLADVYAKTGLPELAETAKNRAQR